MGKSALALRACGTRATLDFNFRAGFNLEDPGSAQASLVHYSEYAPPEKIVTPASDPYCNEIQYFADCLENGKSPEIITPEDSREVLAVILSIRQSLETGETVKINT